MTDPLDTAALAKIEALVDDVLEAALAEIDAVVGVERVDRDQPFWYVRLEGETKANFSAEFTLGQRTLVVESYFMPDPEENRGQVFEHLLVRNRSMYPLHFAIGADTGIYLRGQVDDHQVDRDRVDLLLAATYDCTERYFLPAMRLGFASRFG